MKSNLLIKIMAIGLAGMALLAFCIAVLPWALLFIGLHLSPEPPVPEITYGEFPFRLEFEVAGDAVVTEDILICEYAGVGANEGRGKYRKWESRLASGNEEITLLEIDENSQVFYAPKGAAYYMGDIEEWAFYDSNYPDAMLTETNDKMQTELSFVREDELYEEYQIRIISWEDAEPIVNYFH